jgi:hypothetical protein
VTRYLWPWLVALTACGDNNSLHGTTLVRVDPEPPGEHCANGGVAVSSGNDANGDGVLDDGEIASTEYVCSAASTLVRVIAEPAGANCATGGLAVQSGLDTDGDHVLEDSEVLATSYVCTGPSGTTELVRVDSEPSGANCADGGSAVRIGADTNGNGVLDDSEVTATTYVCNGANTVIRVAAEAAGANCATGGFAISSGADTNGNGVLDDAEITATTYACNPAAPPAPPTVTVFDSSRNDNWPRVGVKAPAGTTFQLYTDAACAGPIAYSAPGMGPGAGYTRIVRVEVPDNSTTTFYANVTSAAGTSDCVGPRTYTEDSSKPPAGGAATCATSAGGPSSSIASTAAVAADADGSVVVAGYFEGPFVLGRGELGETTLAATRGIFLARYRADCSLVWAREIAGPVTRQEGNNVGFGLVVSGSAIIVGGTFTGSATFGVGETLETTLTAAGNDGFIARFEADGTFSWVKQQLGGGQTVQVMGVASSSDGSLYVSGWFDGDATFGPNDPAATSFTNTGTAMFVARLADDGSLIWVRSEGGIAGWAEATAVTAIADGSVAITGAMHASVTFGAGEPNETTITSHGNGLANDVIVARYLADGTLAWVKQAGDQGQHAGVGIAASLDGAELTVTGWFGSSVEKGYIEFGAGEPTDVVFGAYGFNDAFVARYRVGDGSFVWAKEFGGDNGSDEGRSVAATSDGGVIVTGTYGWSTGWGMTWVATGEPNETILVNQGYDAFVARYTSTGQLAWIRDVSGPTDDNATYGVAVSPDGSATIAGRFRTSAIVDTATFADPTLTSSGVRDAFIARFDP